MRLRAWLLLVALFSAYMTGSPCGLVAAGPQTTKVSWPELVGMDVDAARAMVLAERPDLGERNIIVHDFDAMVTMVRADEVRLAASTQPHPSFTLPSPAPAQDYRANRVRIFVKDGKVSNIPQVG